MNKIKEVHFTVCPIFLTGFVRDVWAEGNYKRSLAILSAAFPNMSDGIKFDIIEGKLKLVSDKKDKDLMRLAKDKWKPDLSRCSHEMYPDPKEGSRFDCIDDLIASKEPPKKQFPEMKMYGGYDSLEEMNMAVMLSKTMPTAESFADDQESRRQREWRTPKEDSSLEAESGWITPDGKFYACLTKMEHVWLAGRFELTEAEAECNGWIKITKDLFNKLHIIRFDQNPTQKQINTVFDWCEKHNFELPKWAGGK